MIEARPPSADGRTTNRIAFVVAICAVPALLASVFVMASRPWGCSTSSESSLVSCDWATSRLVAAVWLAAGLAVCLVAFKRWALLLAVISAPLLAISLISVVGVFTMAPAALWFACALWLWTKGHRLGFVFSGIASLVLIYLSTNGVLSLLRLYSTPF